MTLKEKLELLGWTTGNSLMQGKKLIYDADGDLIGECNAHECWELIRESESESE